MKYVRTFEIESWLEANEEALEDERDAALPEPDAWAGNEALTVGGLD